LAEQVLHCFRARQGVAAGVGDRVAVEQALRVLLDPISAVDRGVQVGALAVGSQPGEITTGQAFEDEAADRLDGEVSVRLSVHPFSPKGSVRTGRRGAGITSSPAGVWPIRQAGAQAVFLTGCCGQINTGHTARASLAVEHATALRSFAEAERLGRILAGVALQAVERAIPPGGAPLAVVSPAAPVRALRREVDLPLLLVEPPDQLHRQAAAWREQAASLLRSGATGEARLLQSSAQWADATADMADPTPSVRAEVMVLALGELTLVLLPGEPFFELGQAIKRRAGRRVVVLGYANGSPGYLPHRSAYAEGGYEVVEAHHFYGQPTAFAPEAGERLVEAAIDLVAEAQAS
jgi:hypothetical protein